MSEDSIFRKQEIPLGDRVITLQFKPITEVFKFEEPPYIIVGVSTAGKTTLCLDILNKFSRECTNIYYITSTEENLKDDSISMIPRAFRRKPKFEILYNVWKEIRAQYEATNVDPVKLGSMLISLIGQDVATTIINNLQAKKEEIQKTQFARYRSKGYSEDQVIKYAKDDAKAFYIDTIAKLILDFAKTKGTRPFSDNEMMILNSFVSKAPRVMLLLDDVSSEMDGLKRDKKKVSYEGQTLSTADAYKSLIIDILTRGRHYGALICLFLHSIDLLNEKSYINNLVILNDASAQKVINAKTFPEDMRKTIAAVKSYVFNSSYPYHFLYLSSLDPGKLCVSKASLHINEELPLSTTNKLFVKAFNDVLAGTVNEANVVLPSDDDYDYSYSEEGGDDTALNEFISTIK